MNKFFAENIVIYTYSNGGKFCEETQWEKKVFRTLEFQDFPEHQPLPINAAIKILPSQSLRAIQ